MPEQLLTVRQLCEVLQCTNEYLYNLIKKGLPVFTQIGNQHRFMLADVLDWLKTQNDGKPSKRSKPRKPRPPLDTLPLPMSFPMVKEMDLESLPLERTESAPKAERAIDSMPYKKNLRQMNMIEKAANLHKLSLNTLAVQTAGNGESIAHTKQGLVKACSIYATNTGQCCEKRPAACPLTAYETLLKAKDGLK